MRDQIPIFLVEDDEVDVMTMRRALKDLRIANPLLVAGDGEAALQMLREGRIARPCVILLDLNMPRMGGIEFLQIIKADPLFRSIPVIVLTTSREESDRVETFKLSVAGYMIKPADYLQFVEVVRTIDLYWTLSELPD
ncbi:MAG: two-component system response regulator [Betaproteobacteria bacterium]|nr:two-component system response regulator [Betaproteobacteria bacterium]